MAELLHNVDLNLMGNSMKGMRLEELPSHPTLNDPSKKRAYMYYNTTDETVYVYTGAVGLEWLDLGQLYTHPLFPGTGQPATALTGAQIISRVLLDNGHVTGITTRNLTPEDIGAAAANHTHLFSEITGLPTNTFLGNNGTTTGPAKALTVADVQTMLGISMGTLPLLTAGTDTAQRTWTAKILADYVTARLGTYLTAVNLALGTRTSTTLPITNSAGTGVTLPVATTVYAGLLSSLDKVKLDGVEAGANKYVHPTQNPGAHPFATEITSGVKVLSQMTVNTEGHTVGIKARDLTAADLAAVLIDNAINDGVIQTWGSAKILAEIQNAVSQAGGGALIYKGEYNPVTNTPNIIDPTIPVKQGWTFVVSNSGTFVGHDVEAGDMIIAKSDAPGNTSSNWQVVNKNIPAIVAATTTIAGIVMLATSAEGIAGTNNTKAITPAVLKAVLDARVGGYVANFGDGSSLTYTITHGLNTQDVIVEVRRVSDRKRIIVDDAASSANTVVVNVNTAPGNNAYRIVIKK